MDAARRMIESVKERKKIESARLANLRTAVKDSQENRRKRTEQQSRPD